MKYIITLLLVFLFPVRFLIGTLPHYGLAWLSSFLLYVEVGLLATGIIYALIHLKEVHINKNSKTLFVLYILYFSFIFNQVMVSPQISRDFMSGVPLDNSTFFRDFTIQSVSIFLVCAFRKHIDLTLFAKITSLLTFFTYFAYFNNVGYGVYGVYDIEEKQTSQDSDIITSFAVAGYMAFAFFCNYTVKDKWTKVNLLNRLFFYTGSIVFVVGLFLTIKRGPIISFLTVCGLYFYIKQGTKISLMVFLVLLVFFIFGDPILGFLQENAEGLVYRFTSLSDDNGSHRYGDADSVYNLALSQIEESPFWGSYFRLLHGSYYGSYPHNIILELLMTEGLFVSIPFFVLLWKVFMTGCRLVKIGGEESLSALCFLYAFMSLMTSGSLLFKEEFWVFIAILSSYNLKLSNVKI